MMVNRCWCGGQLLVMIAVTIGVAEVSKGKYVEEKKNRRGLKRQSWGQFIFVLWKKGQEAEMEVKKEWSSM